MVARVIDRFVLCGEALIDLLPAESQPDTAFHTNWEATSAGGPMNSALALQLLGEPATFLGRLSRDAFGEQLRRHLTDNGVDLSLAVATDQPTSVAVVSLDEAGKASYAFHFDDTANFQWRPEELPTLAAGDWLHTGTLAGVVEPGASVLLEWARGTESGLSYDVNVRPTVVPDPAEYWRRVEPWLAACGAREQAGPGGIVKASDDDVAFLARGSGHPGDPAEVMAAWVEEFGLGIGVLTLGAHGALACRPGQRPVRVPGFRVEVVDTISAGDTFMAGFLAAHRRDPNDVAGALRHGTAAAAIVCTRVGCQPPTGDEVAAFLARRG